MPIFCSDTLIRMGGTRPSLFVVVVADKLADLLAFNRRWSNSDWNMTPAEREIYKKAIAGSQERDVLAQSARLKAEKVITTSLTLPSRGLAMHKSRTQIRVLVKEAQSQFLRDQDYAVVPKMYIPVLNLLLRKEYSRQSGVGMTEEVEAFFRQEIRGKLIELLRSGQWVDHPESSDLENLNQQLENFDLGRRSDLKFSSNQDSLTSTVSEKYTPKHLSWKPAVKTLPDTPVEEPLPEEVKPELKGLGGFHMSKYVKDHGIN